MASERRHHPHGDVDVAGLSVLLTAPSTSAPAARHVFSQAMDVSRPGKTPGSGGWGRLPSRQPIVTYSFFFAPLFLELGAAF
jgi:hypothetical protein